MTILRCPQIIHQIWSGIDGPLPQKFKLLSETWKYDYPDWRYEFWNNQRIRSFMQERYPHYWGMYCKFPYNIQRWDAIRYLILKDIGGMYVDFDYESIHSLDVLIQDKTCCFSMENPFHCKTPTSSYFFVFNNALMLSIPNHPFMNKIVEEVFSEENVCKEYVDKIHTVFKTTGPFVINQLYNGLTEEEKSQIYLIPAKFVSPFNYQQTRMIRNGAINHVLEKYLLDAYAVHYYLGAWIPRLQEG